MSKISFRTQFVGIIGNILQHYDTALFGLLVPFIASLFFEKSDPLTALILTYAILPMGFLIKPIGSLFFGWVGDRFGRKRALCISLLGMAAVSVTMGCLPTYATAGIWAPILLTVCRGLQSFCAAGENIGGAVFLLEHTPKDHKDMISSIFNATTILGALIASIAVMLCSMYFIDAPFWRWLYWSGGIIAFVALPIRFQLKESAEFIAAKLDSVNVREAFSLNWKPLLAIIFVTGFSYTTYSLPFTLMNAFVPLVTSVTKVKIVQVTTFLFVLDMCTLPFFGYLAGRISKEKIMLFSALFTAAISLPLFYLLHIDSLAIVVAIRTIIVLCGVAFSATYYSWVQELVAPQYRYTILSIGYAIGALVIGAPTSSVCLWCFKKTGFMGVPAIYLMITSLLAALMVYRFSFKPASHSTNRDSPSSSEVSG